MKLWSYARLAVLSVATALLPNPAPALTPETAACAVPKVGNKRPWLDTRYSPRCRASYVVASFKTLDEKLAMLVDGRSETWLTDRGLPALRDADGPAGVRGVLGVTAFPTPLTVAASFDVATAALYGRTVGAEFRNAGFSRMGGPALDIARTWHFGRVTESLGEDPFLIASIAGAEVAAVQSTHVMNMIKHFAVYTQEQGRAGDHPLRSKPAANAIVSERAMREIYFPGFEAAVKKGGAGQVMCSFLRVNGIYACENPFTLGVLKAEWGFDGTVVPDFPDAQRSIVAAVNAGLDMGQFVGKPPAKANERASALITASDDSFDGEDIRVAVRAGRISPARIEDLIMRRLVPEFRVGTFDHVTQRPAGDASTAAHRQIAADIVAAGAVLLKNKGAVLPLGPGVRSIAVIGTQAGVAAVVTEMGSAYVTSTHTIAAFPAIRQRAPAGTRVDYAPGTLGLERLPLAPASLFHTPSGSGGWQADYVANPNLDFSAKPFLSRVEDVVNNDTMPTDTRFPANRLWSVRWRATFVPTETGVQKFTLAGSGTARLTIGGKLIGRYANVDFGDTIYANLPMEAGKPIAVEIAWTPRVTFRESASDAYGTTLGPVVRFGWARPDGLIADAVEAARKADVAVVFAGHKVGEGMDRLTLGLPNDQEALIEAVAAANPRTLVMLQTGGAVSMPWLGKVAGVIEMWLPGDSIGPAAAQLLFGDVDPGGRLPVTFPADEEQGPASEASQYPGSLDPATGALDAVHFDEGLFVGYRYWDARDQKPLFPFGYGLSYTSFDIVGRDVLKTADGGVIVDVVVRNTGGRPGSEVVQVYVGFPASAGEPPRQLKGFQKVSLKPGEARAVRIRLDSRAFQYWSDGERRWVTDAGSYQVMVGRSSREILYSNKVQLAER